MESGGDLCRTNRRGAQNTGKPEQLKHRPSGPESARNLWVGYGQAFRGGNLAESTVGCFRLVQLGESARIEEIEGHLEPVLTLGDDVGAQGAGNL